MSCTSLEGWNARIGVEVVIVKDDYIKSKLFSFGKRFLCSFASVYKVRSWQPGYLFIASTGNQQEGCLDIPRVIE